MSSEFIHLHVHSEYSLLDGGSRVDKLIQRTKDLGMSAVALTDHGVMHGAYLFHKEAKKEGIKPIIGMEAYVAPGHRSDTKTKTPAGRDYYHLVILAQNATGYKNLTKLTSMGFTEGFYKKPRIDRQLLAKHNEGLVVTSACLASEIAQNLLAGNVAAAEEAASWYANVFKDRFYLEVQGHDSPDQAKLNAQIFILGAKLGIPVVATNDAHFLTHSDHRAHDTLLCIGLQKEKKDQNRMVYDDQLYFKSAEEMRDRFNDRPDCLSNTLRIADEVDIVFDKKYHVPAFPIPGKDEAIKLSPEEQTREENELLRQFAFNGARERYGDSETGDLPDHVKKRLEYELEVISNAGYAGYHLIVQDFINWARENNIPVGPGRGSAAGSIVCYCVGITDLCPLEYDLLFERFLNPSRVSMPDIDVDFCFEGRGKVIDYVRHKYGEDAVAQIVTFGTMKSRAVVKDVGRVLGFSPQEMDRISKAIPNSPAYSLTIEEAVEKVPEISSLLRSDERSRELIEDSIRLEGLARHASIHAAGIVIAPGPIDDYVPISTQSAGNKGSKDSTRVVVTQYDMNCVEQVGLLKMDFLGLKTLTVIDKAGKMIKDRYGINLTSKYGRVYIQHPGKETVIVDENDPETYALIAKGKTAGIFQFESELASDKLRAMKADRFDDLIATNALIRPGPLDMGMDQVYIRRKLGQEEVKYPHADLREALESTYGVIVYQEQVMRIAQVLSGFSLAEADVLRKAVGKKDAELIKKELGKFIEKGVELGHDKAMVQELADQIEAFGRYGFNKSHSAAYSKLSFQTAYLKAHYPAEFIAAMLSSYSDKTEDITFYLSEAKDLSIPVLLPSVIDGEVGFNVVDDEKGIPSIRVGLSAIKAMGDNISYAIVGERKNGPYVNFFDFVDRNVVHGLNKKHMEVLVGAGACDSFGHRAQLMHAIEGAISSAQKKKKSDERGELDLFATIIGETEGISASTLMTLPEVPLMSKSDMLEREVALIGFSVSGHPMDEYEEAAKAVRTHRPAQIQAYVSGKVKVAGILKDVVKTVSKSDKRYGKGVIEDSTGSIGIVLWQEALEKYEDFFHNGSFVTVEGQFYDTDKDLVEGKRPDLKVSRVSPLEYAVADGNVALKLKVNSEGEEKKRIFERVAEELSQNPGAAPVLVSTTTSEEYRLARSRVKPTTALIDRLRQILGAESVMLEPIEENEPFSQNRKLR